MLYKKEEIIPKGEVPEKMPSGLHIKYICDAFFEEEELTEENLNKLLKGIQKGNNIGIFLCQDVELEGSYMNVEIDNGWISILINEELEDGNYSSYCSFNPDYLDSDEISPMNHSDGQSIIYTRETMHDLELAALCTEYYARTGKPYPGMAWLKD